MKITINDEQQYKYLIELLSKQKDKTMQAISDSSKINITWIKDFISQFNTIAVTIVAAVLNVIALGYSNYFTNIILVYFGLILLIFMLIYSAWYVNRTISERDCNIQKYITFIKNTNEEIMDTIHQSMMSGKSYSDFYKEFEKKFYENQASEKNIRGEEKMVIESHLDFISALFIFGFISMVLSMIVPL